MNDEYVLLWGNDCVEVADFFHFLPQKLFLVKRSKKDINTHDSPPETNE